MSQFNKLEIKKIIDEIHLSNLEFFLKNIEWLKNDIIKNNDKFQSLSENFLENKEAILKSAIDESIIYKLKDFMKIIKDLRELLDNIQASFNAINDSKNSTIALEYSIFLNDYFY